MHYLTEKEAIRASPEHPRMGRTRFLTLGDFITKFDAAVGVLSSSLKRSPSIPQLAKYLKLSERSLYRYCDRSDMRTPARAVREVSEESQ